MHETDSQRPALVVKEATRMHTRARLLAAMALVATSAIAACSSSANKARPDGGGNTKSTGSTLKLGVFTDLTGNASSSFMSTEKGVKAYVDSVNAAGGVNGQKLEYVMVDTASTTTGALTAAQQLVQKDKVFAVIENSAYFYAAEPYLLKAGMPVVGGGFDGPEWTDPKNTNLFDSPGTLDVNGLNSAAGVYMKARGVTSCGSIGYPSSVSSSKLAAGAVESCKAAGLKSGYVNTQVPFGSTDVGAIALAIQKAGVDGLYLPVVPSTGFALAGALKQLGVKMKSILFTTGYGGDLLASKAAVQAAQGYEFESVGQPVEANTPATQKFVKALAAVGVTTTPTFAEQEAYIATSAFVAGLKAASANASQASFMQAMRGLKDFDADGLMTPSKIDFGNFAQFGAGSGPGGCISTARLTGEKFVPVEGTPVCGQKLK
jgi:branched-chain amino acid transport system substrate-binding protein